MRMKTDLSQSCGHCWVFCWRIECNTLTASSFRIWNSSTEIPSLPLVLFVVMLPKAHLTSHSRMSGSKWVITLLWLCESWRSFLYKVYSASLVAQRVKHLPAMQETCVRSLGQEDPLEKEMVTHSSILAWKIPWTGELGKLQCMRSQRVRHNWATSLSLFTFLCILATSSNIFCFC